MKYTGSKAAGLLDNATADWDKVCAIPQTALYAVVLKQKATDAQKYSHTTFTYSKLKL